VQASSEFEYGERPSPGLVAAWLAVGRLRPERVPLWAAYWLAEGFDGEALRELAGLHGDDPYDVRDLLPAALREAGVDVPLPGDPPGQAAFKADAISTLYRDAAVLFLEGRVSAQWVASQVNGIISEDAYSERSQAQPLGDLLGIDDEWDEGWGRPHEQLLIDVRAACEAQLRQG
jgi:hypothetical protein